MENYDLLCQYSALYPQQILQVEVLIEEEEDLLLFYKGHVSSLMRATPADEGTPLWSEGTQIQRIELLRAPYDPVHPVVLVAGMSIAQVRDWVEDAL
jgi:hypothetical protein